MPVLVWWYAIEDPHSTVLVEIRAGDTWGNKDARVIDGLEAMEVPEKDQVGLELPLRKRYFEH